MMHCALSSQLRLSASAQVPAHAVCLPPIARPAIGSLRNAPSATALPAQPRLPSGRPHPSALASTRLNHCTALSRTAEPRSACIARHAGPSA